jgi:hypothetical protein
MQIADLMHTTPTTELWAAKTWKAHSLTCEGRPVACARLSRGSDRRGRRGVRAGISKLFGVSKHDRRPGAAGQAVMARALRST